MPIISKLKGFVSRRLDSYEAKLHKLDEYRRERNRKLMQKEGYTPESYSQLQAMEKAIGKKKIIK